MRSAKDITDIVIHCSAGFGGVESIKKYWASKGWRAPGYHILICLDGTIHTLLPFNQVSNGVAGFNSRIINICYIGGVENKGTNAKPLWKGKDTRTVEQKCALTHCIKEALNWLKDNGNTCSKVIIRGHRDFSPDLNGNGVIESWERIKECPSFNAITEYAYLNPRS